MSISFNEMDNLPLQQFYNYCGFLEQMVKDNEAALAKVNSR